jgi:phosphotriesterase-related protein
MRVESVRGAMAVDGLGTTLMHEHVFVLTPNAMQNYGHEWRLDEQDRGADAVRKLQGLKDAGVDSIVDPTVVAWPATFCGRSGSTSSVDINIIVATGLYTFDEIPHFFYYRGPGTILDGPELMAEMFVNDIRHGIGGTEVRAAFLKRASRMSAASLMVETVSG